MVAAMVGSLTMSPLVTDAPAACVDHARVASLGALRRMPVADSTPRPLLTKRRPVDFGLVTSCLCRLR
jgi:hypothetical protein